MRVGDDDASLPLSVDTVAGRGARLARAAMEERDRLGPDASDLAFIIGSEVPVPGGTQHNEDSIAVTRVEDFEETVRSYRDTFLRAGLAREWESVVAVVVQPGVEFSDTNVFQYRSPAAKALMRALERHPNLVFEGHSTDYQTPECLGAMVADGVGIMKVGPEMTFVLREGLFALDALEAELVPAHRRGNFRAVLETVMLEQPGFWEKYYHGTHEEKMLAIRYSFSDRCRYYLANPEVRDALARLFANYDRLRPTLNIVHQFLPAAADSMMDGGYLPAAGVIKRHLALGVIAKFQGAVS
jgi:D-tagatose-1,6-bisphosphate aldolase subunit GatZ/KbaZ